MYIVKDIVFCSRVAAEIYRNMLIHAELDLPANKLHRGSWQSKFSSLLETQKRLVTVYWPWGSPSIACALIASRRSKHHPLQTTCLTSLRATGSKQGQKIGLPLPHLVDRVCRVKDGNHLSSSVHVTSGCLQRYAIVELLHIHNA